MPIHMLVGSAAGPVASILISHVPVGRDDAGTPSPTRRSRHCTLAALAGASVLTALLTAVAAGVWVWSLTAALHRERHDARHDRLTGLPNRRVVEDLLHSQPGPAVVGLLDLDHLKAVNDHAGHAAGDQLLSVIAARLAAGMTGRGLAARLAGDEFVLLWDRLPADIPADAAGLLRALQRPVSIAGHQHHPSASLGLAVRAPALAGTDLLAAADAAMYAAKRNRTGIHISTLDPAAAPSTGTDASDTGAGAAADTSSHEHGEPVLDPEITLAIHRREPDPDNHGRRGRRAIDHRAIDRRAGRRRNDP
jgi:diguanylate cyclase (GGDEF)-like protein